MNSDFDISYYNYYILALKACCYTSEEQKKEIFLYSVSENDALLRYLGIHTKNTYTDDDLISIVSTVNDVIPHKSNRILSLHDTRGIEMIETYMCNDVAPNCLTMASLLQQVFSAMGLYARVVRCLPIDIHFNDCHAIVEVYSDKDKKWLFFDASNAAYLSNEKGDVLSTLEIRNSFLMGQPPIVHLLGETDGQSTYMKRRYLIYLLKNFCRFSTWQRNSIPYDQDNAMVFLNPLLYRINDNVDVHKEKTSLAGVIATRDVIHLYGTKDFWMSPH